MHKKIRTNRWRILQSRNRLNGPATRTSHLHATTQLQLQKHFSQIYRINHIYTSWVHFQQKHMGTPLLIVKVSKNAQELAIHTLWTALRTIYCEPFSGQPAQDCMILRDYAISKLFQGW